MIATASVALATLTLASTGMMGIPPTASADTFLAAGRGTKLALVVRIDSRRRTAVRATILERIDDQHYRATTTHADLYVSADVPTVMGRSADIAPGAVAYADAVITTPRHADVKRVVIVTPYVTVVKT